MSLAAAARIGARRSGADLGQLHAEQLCAIAEDVIAAVLALDETALRGMMRAALMSSHSPDWFHGEPGDG
jgi:hypothetical protein